jgi:hypothetical protein
LSRQRNPPGRLTYELPRTAPVPRFFLENKL